MYVLFEKWCYSPESNDISVYDAMGFTTNADEAMRWVHENESCRIFKYCPDKKIELR